MHAHCCPCTACTCKACVLQITPEPIDHWPLSVPAAAVPDERYCLTGATTSSPPHKHHVQQARVLVPQMLCNCKGNFYSCMHTKGTLAQANENYTTCLSGNLRTNVPACFHAHCSNLKAQAVTTSITPKLQHSVLHPSPSVLHAKHANVDTRTQTRTHLLLHLPSCTTTPHHQNSTCFMHYHITRQNHQSLATQAILLPFPVSVFLPSLTETRTCRSTHNSNLLSNLQLQPAAAKPATSPNPLQTQPPTHPHSIQRCMQPTGLV